MVRVFVQLPPNLNRLDNVRMELEIHPGIGPVDRDEIVATLVRRGAATLVIPMVPGADPDRLERDIRLDGSNVVCGFCDSVPQAKLTRRVEADKHRLIGLFPVPRPTVEFRQNFQTPAAIAARALRFFTDAFEVELERRLGGYDVAIYYVPDGFLDPVFLDSLGVGDVQGYQPPLTSVSLVEIGSDGITTAKWGTATAWDTAIPARCWEVGMSTALCFRRAEICPYPNWKDLPL